MATRTALPTPAPKVIVSSQPAGAANTCWVTNPTTNARLCVQIFALQDAGKRYPALVLVPGGIGDGHAFVDDATRMASVGIIAVVFDADGRGKSTGQEDYNGYKQQDGLTAVIRFAATLPNVDASKIGVATYSYGITMGSGTLARYPHLPARFLIDWEGPASRYHTSEADPRLRGSRQRQTRCADQVIAASPQGFAAYQPGAAAAPGGGSPLAAQCGAKIHQYLHVAMPFA